MGPLEEPFCVGLVTSFVCPYQMVVLRRVSKTFNEEISSHGLPRYMKYVSGKSLPIDAITEYLKTRGVDHRNFEFSLHFPGFESMRCTFDFDRAKRDFVCNIPPNFAEGIKDFQGVNFVICF